MTEKELISKLNNLQKVSPDQTWLDNNRELLLSQVSNSGVDRMSVWKAFLINFESLSKTMAKPAFALGAFVAVLFTASLFSHQLLNKTKPNDSFYIARIISEKAKLNTIFNSAERDKLAVQFATEHAQDITVALADPQFNTDANKDQVAQLNDSFNKEINTVKTRINHLTPAAKKEAVSEAAASETPAVSIANSSKDNNGMQVFENPNGQMLNVSSRTADMIKNTPATLGVSSSTSNSAETKAVETDKVLDEAKKLFDQKDYDSALNKLKEVNEMIK